jgi:hypothetical protein
MLRSLSCVLMLFAGCASSSEVTLALSASRPTHAKDIRFTRVDIDSVAMLTAVESLCVQIEKVYRQRYLTWAYTAGPYPGTPERPVTFHGDNVSVRQVLDEFCRQTGWKYHWVNIGMVEFQSGPVPGYQPEIRRPRPNQALERTADRREDLLSMMLASKPAAQFAFVSGRSAFSR